MNARWSAVTVDCVDPFALARFWAELFGREVSESLPGWARVGSVDDAQPAITFQPVPEAKAGKTRIHLDVRVDDIDAGRAVVESLGGSFSGRRHDYAEGVVLEMADPEGNEFCLVQYS